MPKVLYSTEKVLDRRFDESIHVTAHNELQRHIHDHPEFRRDGVTWTLSMNQRLDDCVSNCVVTIQAVDQNTHDGPKLSVGLWVMLLALIAMVLYGIFGG